MSSLGRFLSFSCFHLTGVVFFTRKGNRFSSNTHTAVLEEDDDEGKMFFLFGHIIVDKQTLLGLFHINVSVPVQVVNSTCSVSLGFPLCLGSFGGG